MERREGGKEGAFDGFRDFAAARGAGKDFEDPLFRAWGFRLKKRGQKQCTEGIQVPPFRSQVNFKGITRGEGDVRREGGERRKRHGLGVRGNFRRQNGNFRGGGHVYHHIRERTDVHLYCAKRRNGYFVWDIDRRRVVWFRSLYTDDQRNGHRGKRQPDHRHQHERRHQRRYGKRDAGSVVLCRKGGDRCRNGNGILLQRQTDGRPSHHYESGELIWGNVYWFAVAEKSKNCLS